MVLLDELGRDCGIWAWERCLAPSVGLCPLHVLIVDRVEFKV